MTEREILIKLTDICARKEQCLSDVQQKMDRWRIDNATQQKVLQYLVDELFINEKRYTRAFINDKIKNTHYGRRKIEEALHMKRIPRDISAPLLDEIPDETYEEILLPLLEKKQKTITGDSDYEMRMKLIRFAMQRGFSYEQADHCLKELNP